MKLYLCIFNRALHDGGSPDNEAILYKECWPMDTDDEKKDAELRLIGLNLEARQHGVAGGWASYSSNDVEFSWEQKA